MSNLTAHEYKTLWHAAVEEVEQLRDEVKDSWKRENALEELEKRQFKVIMYLQDILEKIASITPCSVTKNIALIAQDEADKMLAPK